MYKLKENLLNKKFNRLTVLHQTDRADYFVCLCICGNRKTVKKGHLISGGVKSCGCLKKEKFTNYRHGKRKTATYSSWAHMKERCTDINSRIYQRYGAQGILMCERWSVFANFLEDMGDRPEGTTIDRVDNSKGYFKENCRWATKKEQSTNRTSTRFITWENQTYSIKDWSELKGIAYRTLVNRFDAGWTTERALTERPNARCKRLV